MHGMLECEARYLTKEGTVNGFTSHEYEKESEINRAVFLGLLLTPVVRLQNGQPQLIHSAFPNQMNKRINSCIP